MKKVILTYFILTAILTNGLSQSFTIKADRDSILIGEPITLELTLQKETINDLFWINFQEGDSLGDSFEVLQAFDKDTVVKNATILTQQLIITSFTPGNKVLQPIVLQSESGVITSNAININVRLVDADTTQPFKDLKPIVEADITFTDKWNKFLQWIKTNWYYTILIVLVLAFLIWFLFIRKKKKEEVTEVKVQEPKVAAHIKAFEDLTELNKEKLWQQGKQKEFNYRLTTIIKQYITDRFNVDVKGKTSDEILHEGKVMIGSENRDKLKKLLTLSDLVKFAKELPTEEENKQTMDDAIQFVESTKKEN